MEMACSASDAKLRQAGNPGFGLGGFNFGGGNGQLDLDAMEFGWACG